MSTTLRVRSYAHHDEDAVVRLWQTVFADDPPWNAPREMIRRKLEVQPDLFLVATLDAELVGTVVAGFDGVRGWIHHLAVTPTARRRGVASALMAEAEARLRALGCPKLNLQVRAGNRDAEAFYAALGFAVEARTSFGKRL
ncbi:MAG: GNAT family acetyltransferase [Spirochaetaceae bacterium]|nr:GNAT family acetyltransferase [Myxococcales bacterium]MCB9724291.1 GNAT family acetyltransferase [Spirochaetaceae bacterium]